MGTDKVFVRRRPLTPIVLAMAIAVVAATLGVSAGPAVAKTHRYRGAAPGSVTCQLSGTISFSPAPVGIERGDSTRHLNGKLSGCDTSDTRRDRHLGPGARDLLRPPP